MNKPLKTVVSKGTASDISELRESSLYGFRMHEQHMQLINETHARAALGVSAPCVITHLLFHSAESDSAADRVHLNDLINKVRPRVIEDGATDALFALETGMLRWSRHTEFSTYTFFENNKIDARSTEIERLMPQGWRSSAPGKLVLALKIHVDDEEEPIWWDNWDTRDPAERSGCLITISGGAAIVWCDFRTRDDGYLHIYVKDGSGNAKRRGRMVQRLLDMESYRLLSLLALPEVKRIGPKLAEFDREIAEIANDLATAGGSNDEDLLTRLTNLAAGLEDLAVTAQFRLNASTAYASIVETRLSDLREGRVEGHQRISSFILRRLQPAVRTYQSVLERQAQLASLVARLSDLLRARVDVALEKQNQALLGSMDQRVQQQLKLQKTVEGFSVIAISYYLIGILMYFIKPMKDLIGFGPTNLMSAAAIPVIVFVVWFAISKIRSKYD